MQALKQVLPLYRPQRSRIALLVTLVGISIIVGLAQAWPMAVLVDSILAPGPREDWVHQLFLAPLPDSRIGQIIGIALIGMLLKIFQDATTCARTMLNNRIRLAGLLLVRTRLYNHLQTLDLHTHKSRSQGDTLFRVTADTHGYFGILDTFIGAAIAVVMLIAMTCILLSRSVSLTLFALAIAPLLIAANLYFAKRIRKQATITRQRDADVTTTTQRALGAMPIIQAFSRQRFFASNFHDTAATSNRESYRLHWLEALHPLVVQILFAVGGAVIFGYGGYMAYQNQILGLNPEGLSIGDLIVFMAYLGGLWDPLCRITGFSAAIQGHRACVDRVESVLALQPHIQDHPDATALPVAPRTLTLRNLSFAYAPAAPRTLSHITATIPHGQMVAFVGPSGAGKSSLLNLLMRFYDPTAGGVLLGGTDLRRITLASLRQHIALVSQDCPLIVGTIAENIAFAGPDASMSQIIAAAEAAGAHDFIASLADGYDTRISENAGNLSGGQRQRLAIARAILADTPILLLDEPTSAQDPAHAAAILETLRTLAGKHTVILVTHDLDAAAVCDHIYVLSAGRLAEHGTHAALLHRNGLYANMLTPTLTRSVA